MTEEIKEILDRAKKLKYKCDCCEEIAPGKYIMRDDKQTDNLIEAVYIIDKLLDYITNLQQENERLKEKINTLKSNFEVEIDDCENYKKWYRDYKSRCEKAMEYINENLTLVSILDGKKFYGLNDYKFDYQDLLKILNGSDENE